LHQEQANANIRSAKLVRGKYKIIELAC